MEQQLQQVVAAFGTPCYAYDIGVMRRQVVKAKHVLPSGAALLYSLKANPNLSLSAIIAGHGVGADVASAGELLIAFSAGVRPNAIFVSGPHHSDALLAITREHPHITLSVDSPSELQRLRELGIPARVVLRLQPDYTSAAQVPAGATSRFGIAPEELAACRRILDAAPSLRGTGFHVFAGSQILDAQAVVEHLSRAAALAARAAATIGFQPEVLHLGGGFGVPYCSERPELDLQPVATALADIASTIAPARLVIELGRYLVAQAGWYLTRVVAKRNAGGHPAVVVDGGTHHHADLCGLGLHGNTAAPLLIGRVSVAGREPTDVLGCLCLPSDFLAEGVLLPPLCVGDVLAFPNAGAYGLSAAPSHFLSHPLPPEVGFYRDDIQLLRGRASPASELEAQRKVAFTGPALAST